MLITTFDESIPRVAAHSASARTTSTLRNRDLVPAFSHRCETKVQHLGRHGLRLRSGPPIGWGFSNRRGNTVLPLRFARGAEP
jgi:hypothetical protein